MSEPVPSAHPGVHLRVDGAVATLTLDAPERGNRLNLAAMRVWISGLADAAASGADMLVTRGEGPDFTLGRDGTEQGTGISRNTSLRLILEANRLLTGFPGVSVALVQGRVLGFGSGVALQADITLPADDAVLGFDEVLHGLAPLVVLEYLPRYVGPKVARKLMLTGRPISAAEALVLRMVSRLVPAAELEAEGSALVEHLRGLHPSALRLMKAYAGDHAAGRLADPQGNAVDRLDAWIEAGRP